LSLSSQRTQSAENLTLSGSPNLLRFFKPEKENKLLTRKNGCEARVVLIITAIRRDMGTVEVPRPDPQHRACHNFINV
jgi:hypothetical protein